MSNHFGNPLISLSPRTNSPYLVSKFENDNNHSHRRSRSFNFQSSGGGPATAPDSGNKPLVKPTAVTPTQRRFSFTGPSPSQSHPSVVTPNHSYELESPSSEESPSVDRRQTLSVIGLPSEYPVYHRQDSVSSFATSSICSSLIMEELDDFELFFGADGSFPKVYDSGSVSEKEESPLKIDLKCHPPLPPIQRPAHLRSRAVSEDAVSPNTPTLLQRPSHIRSRALSDSASIDSRDTRSSESRRRRNYGLNENDFEKLTNEFSSLVVQL
jgi:hypothetical protein